MRKSALGSWGFLTVFLMGWGSLGEAQPPPERGELSGSLLDGETHQPLANVSGLFQLLPLGEANRPLPFQSVTDGQGRYLLSDLQPGDYDLILVVPEVGYAVVEALQVDGEVHQDLSIIPVMRSGDPSDMERRRREERGRWQRPVAGDPPRLFPEVRYWQARALDRGGAPVPAFEAMRAACEWILRHSAEVAEEEKGAAFWQTGVAWKNLVDLWKMWGVDLLAAPTSTFHLDLWAAWTLRLHDCAAAAVVGMEEALRSVEREFPQAVPVARSYLLQFHGAAKHYDWLATEGLRWLEDPQCSGGMRASCIYGVLRGAIHVGRVPQIIAALEGFVRPPVSREDQATWWHPLQYSLIQLHWATGNPQRGWQLLQQSMEVPADAAAYSGTEMELLAHACQQAGPRPASSPLPRPVSFQRLGLGRGGGFSPGGRYVAYGTGMEPLLAVQSTEPGSTPEPYHFGSEPLYGNPAWSPDGNRLAWASLAVLGGEEKVLEGRLVNLWVAELPSGHFRKVAGPLRMPLGPLGWLADSQHLLFSAFVGPLRKSVGEEELWYGVGQICLLEVDSGQIRPLMEAEPDDRWPVLRPQGDLVACDRGGDIWIMAPDGTGLRPLTHYGRSKYPQWSPDGQAVAFYHDDFGGALWIVELESGRTTKVLSGVLQTLSEQMNGWVWRPDGRGLLFCSHGDLYVTERSVYALPRLLPCGEVGAVQGLIPPGHAGHGKVLVESADGLQVITWEIPMEEELK